MGYWISAFITLQSVLAGLNGGILIAGEGGPLNLVAVITCGGWTVVNGFMVGRELQEIV